MGKNENLLTLYGCDSINTIQGHDFSLCIFLQLKAKLDLKTQISSGLAIGGGKKAGNNKISDQICKLVSVKRMIDEGL